MTSGSPLSNVGLKLVWTQMLGSSTQVRTERKGSDCAGRQTARDGSHPYSRLILILMLIHTQVLLIVVMMISHSADTTDVKLFLNFVVAKEKFIPIKSASPVSKNGWKVKMSLGLCTMCNAHWSDSHLVC